MVAMALLDVAKATFAYDQKNIFTDLSFHIEQGEVFFLLGPNGCGKTTLLDCILGILKLNSGEIKVNGTPIKGLRRKHLAHQLAYVPQSHEKTFPYTVLDIVLMGRAAYIGTFSTPSAEDAAIAETALESAGIIHLRDRSYTQLSGGEGQLVMIARALAQQAPLVIMDEPTAHLDLKNEMVVMETIGTLARESGIAIIMATHFPNHAFYFENNGINTRIALMNNAAFQALGTPCEVLSEENLNLLYDVNTRVVSFAVNGTQTMRQVIPIASKENADR
jgi:iron complex transport system ATP-binding protein